MDETREIDIDLRKILYMLKSKIIFIILITLVFGISAGLYTHYFITPTYSATISMCVYSNPDMVSSGQAVTPNEINAAKNLVGTYRFIVKSDLVLDKVAEELNLGSGSSISSAITTSEVEESFVFKVTVTTSDAQRSTDIANTIAKIAPQEMVKAVKAGTVNIIDTAKKPHSPSSPNLKKNILLGLAIGFTLSFAGFFIYELFDTTITNAKDLEREFELPVLGTVPLLDRIERNSQGDEDGNGGTKELEAPKPTVSSPSPSNALLENLQSMKGGTKND
jgi:capsular polysaccharide biosynthesis protein